jgi:hypothetical protein
MNLSPSANRPEENYNRECPTLAVVPSLWAGSFWFFSPYSFFSGGFFSAVSASQR